MRPMLVVKEKRPKNQGRSTKQKTPVMGLFSDGLVHAEVIPNATKKVFQEIINKLVRPYSMIISDEWGGYNDVEKKNPRSCKTQNS